MSARGFDSAGRLYQPKNNRSRLRCVIRTEKFGMICKPCSEVSLLIMKWQTKLGINQLTSKKNTLYSCMEIYSTFAIMIFVMQQKKNEEIA